MINSKKNIWLLAFVMVFSLYLFDTPAAVAAPEATVSQNTVQNIESETESNTEPDTVATADAFTAWIESHKNGGGSVKLTNNIVLREFYYFSPNGANRPDIIVDMDTYKITITGNITFLSDGHLIFRGQAGSKGIFHVLKGGMLTLDGIVVEGVAQGTSSQYTLWQEEGAGLLLRNTYTASRVSGEIHYASMPLVTESSSACVVVEKEESAAERLPTQIKCAVNYQGRIQYNRMTPVSWNLSGTEEQQEKRRRFQVEGFSSEAVFGVPPVCTVVYNDYPLTFTDVKATIKNNVYYFQGSYTKPQKELPIIVASEYSFDNSNWITSEEGAVTNVNAPFSICFPCEEWSAVQNPYLYIRLRGKKDGTTYLSNVLRYQAGNMGEVEDLGGDSGTSGVMTPDEPKEDSGDSSSDNQKPSQDSRPQDTESENQKDNGKQQDKGRDNETSGDVSDTDASSENDSDDTNQAVDWNNAQNIAQNNAPNATDTSVSLQSNVPENVNDNSLTTTDIPGNPESEIRTDNDENHETDEPETDEPEMDEPETDESDTVIKGTVEVMSEEPAISADEGNDEGVRNHRQVTVHQRLHTTRNIFIVSGLVTLLVGAGVAGYFVHTSRLRRYKRRSKAAQKGKHRKKE